MKKIKFILPVVAAIATSQAATVNFEAEASAHNLGQGGTTVGDSIIRFYDTAPGSGIGASPRIVNNGTLPSPTGNGLGNYVVNGVRGLANENGTDSSALMMVFSGPVDFASLSFVFNRDYVGNVTTPSGGSVNNIWGRLRVYDNLSDSVIDAAFLTGINTGTTVPANVVLKQGDGVASTFESINYSGEFDVAVFDLGFKDGNGNFVPATIAGNELIDDINYVALAQETPVPEVQTYAGIFGAALAGVEMLRRRRAARA